MNMPVLKYLLGWLSSSSFVSNKAAWIERLQQAEKTGSHLVVFALPEDKALNLIKKIEQLLQDELG